MANAVHCVTDNLLKNNYYYALSTASAGNPTQLPSSDTGIADSGASGFYFAPGAHVANLNSRAPPIGVEVANGLPVRSIASATLASVPSLPAATMQGHVMPSFHLHQQRCFCAQPSGGMHPQRMAGRNWRSSLALPPQSFTRMWCTPGGTIHPASTASCQPQHPRGCAPAAMLGAYACQHAFSWRLRPYAY